MLKFITKTLFISLSILCIYIIAFVIKFSISNNLDWTLSNKPTTVFMGASHVENGINPNYYDNCVNIASSSERYMFTYLKLKKLIEYNPIDTLFLQFAPTDVWEHTDCKYFANDAEMLHFIPLYSPLFRKEEYNVYKRELKDFILVSIKKTFSFIRVDLNSYGGYKYNNKIFNPEKKYQMPDWDTTYGSDINLSYLDKILDLCDKNKIKVYLIYLPMYNPEQFYDQSYYYNLYNTKYPDYELLDYSTMVIPDNYRADEHHLNKDGAIFFTKLLYRDVH